jgi:hypothetical protein
MRYTYNIIFLMNFFRRYIGSNESPTLLIIFGTLVSSYVIYIIKHSNGEVAFTITKHVYSNM